MTAQPATSPAPAPAADARPAFGTVLASRMGVTRFAEGQWAQPVVEATAAEAGGRARLRRWRQRGVSFGLVLECPRPRAVTA